MKVFDLDNWIRTRNTREQVLILLAFLALIFVIWNFLLSAPVDKKKALQLAEIKNIQQGIEGANKEAAQLQELGAAQDKDPNVVLHRKLQNTLKQELSNVEKLAQMYTEPKKLPDIIKNINEAATDVTLVNIKILPMEKLSLDVKTKDQSSNPIVVYKYSIQLDIRSDYFRTLAFIKKIEQLPWHLFWDRVEYKVTTYPMATVMLKLSVINNVGSDINAK